MDTSGFYKKTEEGWFYAPSAVYAKDYELHRDGNKESIDGWEWCDTAPAEYLLWEITQQNN
jgi:hypothetical protein